MEKMSFIFFIIITVYLLYSFFKSRSQKADVKIKDIEVKKAFSQEEKNIEIENAAIAAVIAAVMGDTAYVLKRAYAVAKVDERKSSWRYAGRNEIMTRKNILK